VRRHRWAALPALIGNGCSIGPSYHEPEVAPAGATVGLSPRPDSVRAFYDSLATADSAAAPAPRTLQPDSADLAWLAILKDTTLLGLVNLAVRENRDVQTAVSRIREFRAEVGIARSPLFPQLTGGRLKNQSRAAGARAEQARLQFEQTVLQAFREASDALVAVRTARDQRVAQQSQVVALRRRRSWPTSATRAGSRGTSRCSTPNGSSSRRSWG
jgi:outer membrane protein TolC